jgi:hypothetical protein
MKKHRGLGRNAAPELLTALFMSVDLGICVLSEASRSRQAHNEREKPLLEKPEFDSKKSE